MMTQTTEQLEGQESDPGQFGGSVLTSSTSDGATYL